MLRIRMIIVIAALCSAATADAGNNRMIGINVLLNQPVDQTLLMDLTTHGQILDVIPEINAVTLRARETELAAIQALPYVTAANPDAPCSFAGGDPPEMCEFCDGASLWNLDAINVIDFDGIRSVPYTGAGVYVAVIDSGLFVNWREYFPEERIATRFARAFGGGGGEQG